MTPTGTKDLGVYFHVPWCVSKCPYCDFASRALMPASADRDLADCAARLHEEIEAAIRAHPSIVEKAIATVYFGGGTPSLLPPDEIAGLLAHLWGVFPQTPQKRDWPELEVTVECNPAGADMARLEALRRAGVNRISLGVQSFEDRRLVQLGRAHTSHDAREAVARVAGGGFSSWGIDLIFGLPDSHPWDFQVEIERAVALRPPHISVYGLTLHAGTPLHARHQRGEIVLPDDEEQRAMFVQTRAALRGGGWRHYEISNYALPGHESRHNMRYWQGGDYLGLGVSAHSYLGGVRYANPENDGDLCEALAAGRWPGRAEEPPTVRSKRGETIMLSLRQLDGCPIGALDAQLGCDFLRDYAPEIRNLSEMGWVTVERDRIGLTEEGILLSDQVFETFF